MYRGNTNDRKPPNTTIGRGDPEWERWSRDRVRTGLADQGFKTTINEADVVLLRDKVVDSSRARLDHPTTIVKIAQEMLEAEEFSSVRVALSQAKEKVPEYDANSIPAKREIFARANAADLDFANVDDLAATILHLGQKQFLPLSELGKQEKLQAENVGREELERNALIRSITRGKSAFPLWSPIHGKAMSVSSDSLAHENTQRLREIADSVERYRALRDGRPVAPVQQDVEEGVTATITVQKKTTGYMGDDAQDEFLAHPSDPTREYTPREVKQNIRELLFINGQSRGQARVNAINRVLRGEQFNGPRPLKGE